MLSFWTFSDVFEEGGPAQQPFQGQFGLRATYGINKASFYDFALLHRLGTERLPNDSHDAIVTRLADGSLEVAVWNLASVDAPPASIRTHHVTLHITGIAVDASISLQHVDENHSNVLKTYAAMGKPRYPTPAQIRAMNAASALTPPEDLALRDGVVALDMIPNELAILHISTPSAQQSRRTSTHVRSKP
jgi:xylan 1,4-beta-xylosidase